MKPRALLASVLIAVACSPAPPPLPPPPPAPTHEAGAADAGTEPITTSDAGVATDRTIEAAIARIDRSMLERDLAIVAQPRHHLAAPAGLEAVARHVATELEASGFSVSRAPVTFQKHRADNVIGERAGSEGRRVLIVGAHYDAVKGTAGADDNASGVVGALAVARAVAAAPALRSTVRVVAFAFEEMGLVGSDAYARSLSPDERARVAAVVNLDMIGFRAAAPGTQVDMLDRIRPTEERTRLPADFIAVWAHPKARTTLDALDAARKLVPDLRVETMIVPEPLLTSAPDLMRSDHASFWGVGVPAVSIVDTADARSPHYHKKTDAVATLDLAFAADVARWVAAAVLLLDRSEG